MGIVTCDGRKAIAEKNIVIACDDHGRTNELRWLAGACDGLSTQFFPGCNGSTTIVRKWWLAGWWEYDYDIEIVISSIASSQLPSLLCNYHKNNHVKEYYHFFTGSDYLQMRGSGVNSQKLQLQLRWALTERKFVLCWEPIREKKYFQFRKSSLKSKNRPFTLKMGL